MAIRPFDWRDIPLLHRYRQNSVFLDSVLMLTRGPTLVPGALLSSLAPAMGFIMAVAEAEDGSAPVIGQATHAHGAPFAHLTFLTPDTAFSEAAISGLVEYMIVLAGERGAMRLLADVDDGTPIFDILHNQGFAIYARQRIWQITGWPGKKPLNSPDSNWRPAGSQDTLAIRSLYNNLVPGLVAQVEPFIAHHSRGFVYYDQGDLLAFVELRYGSRGIWVQPFVHPDAEGVPQSFIEFLQMIPSRNSRPVYVCVRSYQSWLETTVEDLGAESGPRQAVMARQMTISQPVRSKFALPALENGQAEISTPIVNVESR